jgi:hypothetical protein
MKSKRNIYTADDILFKLAHVFLALNFFPGAGLWHMVVTGMYSRSGVPMHALPGTRIVTGIFMAALPLSFYAAAILVRRRERRILAVWSALEHLTSAKPGELSRSLNMDEREILEALPVINRTGDAFFSYNAESGTIIDGRLADSTLVAEKCPSCGGVISASTSLSAAQAPRCPYCGSAILPENYNEHRREAIEKIRRENEDDRGRRERLHAGRKKISIPVLVLLIFLCWPAAIYYLYTR